MAHSSSLPRLVFVAIGRGMLELQGLMSGWAANSQRSRAAPRRWRLLSREAVAQIQTGPIGADLRTGSQSEQARPREVAGSNPAAALAIDERSRRASVQMFNQCSTDWPRVGVTARSDGPRNGVFKPWARLVSNQRPLACEARSRRVAGPNRGLTVPENASSHAGFRCAPGAAGGRQWAASMSTRVLPTSKYLRAPNRARAQPRASAVYLRTQVI